MFKRNRGILFCNIYIQGLTRTLRTVCKQVLSVFLQPLEVNAYSVDEF